MLAIEREFVGAIYAIYALDCVHWLKPGDVAFTRRIGGGWKRWEIDQWSFTLLSRMPVIANPIDLRPGWIVLSARTAMSVTGSIDFIQEFLDGSLPDRHVLTVFSAIGGMNLLLLLPAIAMLGGLEAWWIIPSLILLVAHLGIITESYFQAECWRMIDRKSYWREYISLLVNPIAALRSGDVLCKGLFEVKLNSQEE